MSRLILSMVLFASLPAAASGLLECRDASLAQMDAWAMQRALQQAGGRDCRVQEQPWAQTVVCASTSGATAFGLPVHEVRGEITNAGVRRVVSVTRAGIARSRSAEQGRPVADGLRREVEAREDGASLLRCSAESIELAGAGGGIVGPLPALPVGAHGWKVCAEHVDGGAPRCVEASPDGFYRIDGLAAGEYRLRADPLGAADDRLGAVLARRSDLKAGVRRDVLLDHVAVRVGALTQAGEMELIRLPER